MKNKENSTAEAKKRLTAELKKIDNKKSKILFFVYDSKGTPSGSLAYIYETALHLKKMGYNVQMLYSEKEFVGVEDWLGEEYAKLPHYNVDRSNVDISPADVLFIPDVYANVMSMTRNLPCKRVAIITNTSYLVDSMPIGANLFQYGITDFITVSDSLLKTVKSYFPNSRGHVVQPMVNKVFEYNKDIKYNGPIINVVADNNEVSNTFVKPFFWKYPLLRWIPIRNISGLKRSEFAKACEESLITVWLDRECNFGYAALEAMKCGSILVGLVPDREQEWMTNEDGELKGAIWCPNVETMHDTVASIVYSYLHNDEPTKLYEDAQTMTARYGEKQFELSLNRVYVERILEDRKKELHIALSILENNENKEEKKDEQ